MVGHNYIPPHVRLSMGRLLRGKSAFQPYVCKLSDDAMRDDWILAHAGPLRICDECRKSMAGEVSKEDLGSVGYSLLFSITTKGLDCAFLCEWCAEKFHVDGMAGLPNVAAKLDLIDTPEKRQALIALFDLDGKK